MKLIFTGFAFLFSFIILGHHYSAAEIKPSDQDAVFFSGTGSFFEGDLTLQGRLKKPQGIGPFPAVVLLHGCGGIQPKRDHVWAERLVSWGYVTLQVESFRSRGISGVCSYSGTDSTRIMEKRVQDAIDAKKYLAGLPMVKKERIALMGWSHGGWTVLEALSRGKNEPFAAAAAFYPLCNKQLSGLNAPLLILIGQDDDWTPAGACTARMPAGGSVPEVRLQVFPGAMHGFDITGADTKIRGARGTHHLKYQAEADEGSITGVKGFFEQYLKQAGKEK